MKCQYPFAPISFFPSVKYNDILTIECNLEYRGNIHQNFNELLYPDFIFKHNWVRETKEQEKNKQSTGNGMSLADMVGSMETGLA